MCYVFTGAVQAGWCWVVLGCRVREESTASGLDQRKAEAAHSCAGSSEVGHSPTLQLHGQGHIVLRVESSIVIPFEPGSAFNIL
jgi:hypothetical protein